MEILNFISPRYLAQRVQPQPLSQQSVFLCWLMFLCFHSPFSFHIQPSRITCEDSGGGIRYILQSTGFWSEFSSPVQKWNNSTERDVNAPVRNSLLFPMHNFKVIFANNVPSGIAVTPLCFRLLLLPDNTQHLLMRYFCRPLGAELVLFLRNALHTERYLVVFHKANKY